MTWLVVRDDDTLRDRLLAALITARHIAVDVEKGTEGRALSQATSAVLGVLRDVGTPATTETRPGRTRTGAVAETWRESTWTRLVTDWTEVP